MNEELENNPPADDARKRRASMASGGGALLETLTGKRGGAASAGLRQRQHRAQPQTQPLADDEVFGPADGGERSDGMFRRS